MLVTLTLLQFVTIDGSSSYDGALNIPKTRALSILNFGRKVNIAAYFQLELF